MSEWQWQWQDTPRAAYLIFDVSIHHASERIHGLCLENHVEENVVNIGARSNDVVGERLVREHGLQVGREDPITVQRERRRAAIDLPAVLLQRCIDHTLQGRSDDLEEIDRWISNQLSDAIVFVPQLV